MLERMIYEEDPQREQDLRDWYAGMAMQGILTSFKGDFPLEPELLAERSYELADAMMEARK